MLLSMFNNLYIPSFVACFMVSLIRVGIAREQSEARVGCIPHLPWIASQRLGLRRLKDFSSVTILKQMAKCLAFIV